jgi:single-strand DNA-binding protein
MNKVLLTGRLTKDPELRTTGSGLAVASFSLAVTRTFKNKDGNYDADFFNVSVFGKQAANVSKYCFKGSQVGVEGRLQSRSYDAQDGTKRYVTEVVVENVEFVGGKNDASSSTSNSAYVDAPSAAPIDEMPEYDIPDSDPYENYDKEVSLSDNDLPF